VATLLHVAPQAAGQIAAHHHLHRERRGGAGDGDVGVGDVEDVVLHHLLGPLEPEAGQPVEDLALERDGGQHPVEGAQSVGGDEEEAVTLPVDVAHLAPVALAQDVEAGIGEGVPSWRASAGSGKGQRASGGAAAR
jgi:hypothetical protein